MSVRLRPLSRVELQSLDQHAERELGLSTLLLMENAGRGAAAWLAELSGATAAGPIDRHLADPALDSSCSPHSEQSLPRVVVVCGPGNNGGDGGVVARHLDSWGFPVQVVWSAPNHGLRGHPAVQATILKQSGVEQTFLSDSDGDGHSLPFDALEPLMARADWLVDALFGTGLSRAVEGASRALIELMNRSGRPILALDLPSGMEADTGRPLGAMVIATATATFAAPKLGFSAAGAREYTGQVAVIGIGLPRSLTARFRVS